jgi:hypothetical protein
MLAQPVDKCISSYLEIEFPNGFSRDQGVGNGEVVSAGLVVVVVVSAGLVVVVVVSGEAVAVGLAADSVVSVFCSHAIRSAALARMQMYFFIVIVGKGILL